MSDFHAPSLFGIPCPALAAIALAAGLAATPALAQQTMVEESASAFELSDRNSDGSIDADEYRGRMGEIFYFSDRDGDGFVVIAELPGADPAEFRAADTNNDGKLTQAEFAQHQMTGFHAVDADKSGTLTLQEIDSWRP